jgi:hypothetical protein
MQPCKLATGILIGPGNFHRVSSSTCTRFGSTLTISGERDARRWLNLNPEGKYVNTLIRCNQFKEMEEARQNRYNRFLSGCPNRIGSGEPHSLTVADRSPEVDISEDDHEYLHRADLPEMKKDDVRVTVEDGIP